MMGLRIDGRTDGQQKEVWEPNMSLYHLGDRGEEKDGWYREKDTNMGPPK